jgi:hypothetical protein
VQRLSIVFCSVADDFAGGLLCIPVVGRPVHWKDDSVWNEGTKWLMLSSQPCQLVAMCFFASSIALVSVRLGTTLNQRVSITPNHPRVVRLMPLGELYLPNALLAPSSFARPRWPWPSIWTLPFAACSTSRPLSTTRPSKISIQPCKARGC